MSNPYDPASYQPQPIQPSGSQPYGPPPYQDTLDFGRAIQAPFKSPNWIMNVVWVLLCNMLNMVLIGGIVLIGYQMDVIEKRSRGRSHVWPDFDTGRFGEYLTRGLWPWLVNLVLAFGLMIPVWIMMVASIAIVGAIAGDGSPIAGVFLLLVFGLVFVAVVLLMMFIVGPCTLRAGLASDFGQGMNFRWAIDFGKRTWGQILLAMIYLMLVAIIAEFVGAVLCLVGLLVTLPVAQLVMTDFGAQLYDIFLTRGGEPVPRNPNSVNNTF